jgi:S1-C subfamily serine protease
MSLRCVPFRAAKALSTLVLLLACAGARVAAQDEAAAPTSVAGQEEAAMRAAVANVAESVVQIRTIGGLDTVDRTLIADGPTTGLILSADGYIVSSAFNFVQQPASILVTFASGEQAPAELVATDHSRMLVLLRVHGMADLPVPTFAPSDVRVGQWAIAVGRTFRPDRTNVSVGIVSAVNRMFGKAIQTDADVSTANYGGPLVDIRGRVLGVIVPMAPRDTSDVAGVEWYDSGIGFAVPIAPLADRLEQMKEGVDQYPGLMGVALKEDSPLDAPADLAAVVPNGPAGKAGLKKGDRIDEIDGRPIHTKADLRIALGPRYGGESVRVTAIRGDDRVERDIVLTGKLEPFRHGFLGILPMRPTEAPADDSQSKTAAADKPAAETKPDESADAKPAAKKPPAGVVVRMVYPGSAAAAAKIRPGDRILRINDAAIDSIAAAIEEMNNVGPGSQVAVQLLRGGKRVDRTLTAGRLPTNVPAELPPAYQSSAPPVAGAQPPTGETSDLKLPEFAQTCRVYVPPAAQAGPAAGVLLWLHAPGQSQPDAVIQRWKSICDREGLILVVPTAADPSRWEPTEVEYLQRLLQRVAIQYRVDPRRIVVYGRGGGGSMAWLLGLSSREIVRGVATSDAALPRTIRVPDNDPVLRLAVFMELAPDGNMAANVRQSLQKLTAAGYPVTAQTMEPQRKELSAEERDQLARWIDTLDRF